MHLQINEFGEWLKVARERAGINQSEMARRIGCTPGYIYHIERNLAFPNPRLLRKFTKAANIDTKQLKAKVTKVVAERLSEMGV